MEGAREGAEWGGRSPVYPFQKRMMLSPPPDASSPPSGANATDETCAQRLARESAAGGALVGAVGAGGGGGTKGRERERGGRRGWLCSWMALFANVPRIAGGGRADPVDMRAEGRDARGAPLGVPDDD